MDGSMFAEVASRILSGPASAPENGYDKPLWHMIEEAGLDRLLVPESQGGAGDAFADAVAVMVEFGRAGASLPLAESLVANWCLAHAGLEISPGPKAFMLEPDLTGPGILGEVTLDWRSAACAVWMPVVPLSVVVARGDDRRFQVATVSEVRSVTRGETLAGEPLSRLEEGARLVIEQVAPFTRAAALAVAIIALLKSAAIAGALERICEMTIEYANTRKQFGQAISRFQAVQHLAARMACETAAAKAAVEFGLAGLSSSNPLWAVAVAKSRTSEAAGFAAADAHQIHGAIGFTREYELHRHTRRLWAWREQYGNECYWNTRIGSAAIESGSGGLWSGLLDGMEL